MRPLGPQTPRLQHPTAAGLGSLMPETMGYIAIQNVGSSGFDLESVLESTLIQHNTASTSTMSIRCSTMRKGQQSMAQPEFSRKDLPTMDRM